MTNNIEHKHLLFRLYSLEYSDVEKSDHLSIKLIPYKIILFLYFICNPFQAYYIILHFLKIGNCFKINIFKTFFKLSYRKYQKNLIRINVTIKAISRQKTIKPDKPIA